MLSTGVLPARRGQETVVSEYLSDTPGDRKSVV